MVRLGIDTPWWTYEAVLATLCKNESNKVKIERYLTRQYNIQIFNTIIFFMYSL